MGPCSMWNYVQVSLLHLHHQAACLFAYLHDIALLHSQSHDAFSVYDSPLHLVATLGKLFTPMHVPL